jgi:hypothetical protein
VQPVRRILILTIVVYSLSANELARSIPKRPCQSKGQ